MARRSLVVARWAAWGAAATMVVIASAGPASAEITPPTVTVNFESTGLGLLVCGTYPSVTSVNIHMGTRVNLVNQTDGHVSLDIQPGGDNASLNDGDALSVKFKKGQHTVRMIPDCLVGLFGEAEKLEVTVTGDIAPLGVGAPPPTPTPGPTTGPPPGTPDGTGGDPASTPSGPPMTVFAGGEPGPQRPGTSHTGPPSPTPEVIDTPAAAKPRSTDDVLLSSGEDTYGEVLPYTLPDADERGRMLLAVVAAICVLGVTSAIIRAILAQRASGAFDT
jgi:hypothetical protein